MSVEVRSTPRSRLPQDNHSQILRHLDGSHLYGNRLRRVAILRLPLKNLIPLITDILLTLKHGNPH